MIRDVHHVGIAVRDMAEAYALYRDALGLPIMKEGDVPSRGVKAALLAVGGSYLELIQPTDEVSPFAKQAYVSHDTYDYGSILKFIEEVYHLRSLGYADEFAQNDLSDCFDFHRHNSFRKINAPHDAKYFLNDKRAPTDPDDD